MLYTVCKVERFVLTIIKRTKIINVSVNSCNEQLLWRCAFLLYMLYVMLYRDILPFMHYSYTA